jgi:predicted dithiol-disulfide oxidoreductase (DUF899 family)
METMTTTLKGDVLAAERRDLPWVRVEKNYRVLGFS